MSFIDPLEIELLLILASYPLFLKLFKHNFSKLIISIIYSFFLFLIFIPLAIIPIVMTVTYYRRIKREKTKSKRVKAVSSR